MPWTKWTNENGRMKMEKDRQRDDKGWNGDRVMDEKELRWTK